MAPVMCDLVTLRCHIIFDRFCPWSWSFPHTVSDMTCVHHLLPPVWKCNNIRDVVTVWTSRFVAIKQPWPHQLTTKSGEASWQDKSAGYEWFEAASDWWVSWSGTKRYWRRQNQLAQASSCLQLSHRRSFWIFTVTHVSQNIINQWRRNQFASGGIMPALCAGRNFFDVPPHFSIVPPTWGGTTIVCYRLRDNWSGEVGRGVKKSNGT